MNTIPIFPLNVVLFPEGDLQLRLFEPRYIDMVRNCMRDDTGFGICLIKDGKEAGEAAEIFPLGTYSRIVDWEQMEDGLLGITVVGERRFRVETSALQQDNLLTAEVTWLDDDDEPLPESYHGFTELLKEIINRYELPYDDDDERYDEATWVSERLAEILPFGLKTKQTLLEMDNALQRLDLMHVLLEKIDAGDTNQS
ncbi:MAG: LON peptidase substrate-binding domain-containing protein [Gammaproteobacteria bacterium]